MMTQFTVDQLRQRAEELREQSVSPGEVDDVGLRDSEMLLQAADVIAHLSQLQPVAQGEAVAYRLWKDGESTAYTSWMDGKPQEDMLDLYKKNGRTVEYAYATPTIPTGYRLVPVEQDGEVVGFTSEDVHNLHSLRRVLENLSKKRAPDPRDLDAEFFVTANINHAVKSATYWLPIVNDLYLRLYGVLAEKSRNAASPSAGGV